MKCISILLYLSPALLYSLSGGFMADKDSRITEAVGIITAVIGLIKLIIGLFNTPKNTGDDKKPVDE
jgi:hypothetical protein